MSALMGREHYPVTVRARPGISHSAIGLPFLDPFALPQARSKEERRELNRGGKRGHQKQDRRITAPPAGW